MQQGVAKEDKDGGDGMPSELETRVMRKISFRIVPSLCFCTSFHSLTA